MNEYLENIGKRAKRSAFDLSIMAFEKKNEALRVVAEYLVKYADEIIKANDIDMENAINNGVKQAMQDRLKLTEDRIKAMAEGVNQVADLDDPIGEVLEEFERPNGLKLTKVRVPIGVIGIIFESRPNVTADAFSLCFKSGNAVILRGGSDAINSNKAIVSVIREALKSVNVNEECVTLIENTDRALVNEFMKLNKYVDLLIPRGGAGLIRAVVEGATIPVIETGTGNCHVFVDETADLSMAVEIIDNAKTQRMGVCNACESLLVHSKIAEKAIPAIYERLTGKSVEIRAGEKAFMICPSLKMEKATEEDYATEFLGPVISLQVVDSVEEAIEHVNRYTTHHSECIVTSDIKNAEKFTNAVDAACVYVNASTRFTDGGEFGFGAEIGISTQKLHARGPMGLSELTTVKYIINGNGQIR